MDTTLTLNALMTDQDKRISETVSRERGRLGNFIRRRVPDASEAEDILQDVFYEFVRAYRLPEPIEQVGAWLFGVARNRIIDRFRKKKDGKQLHSGTDTIASQLMRCCIPAPATTP